MARWIGLAAILILGGYLMVHFGFSRPDAAEKNRALDVDDDVLVSQRPQFGEDRVVGEMPKPAAFDGKRAMKYLEAICAIGPRMSGTGGMRRQQELIRKHFEGAKVTDQTFEARQNSKPQAVEMTNLIVSYKPEAKRRVILCSHYDTRPIADQEPNPRHWTEPFVSANDGGSGVAFLMEMGNHMKDLKIDVGVDFVFFDGEEYIFDPRPDRDRYFFGSEHFAKTWFNNKQRPQYLGAVLLDMIAGKNAKFPWEGYSKQRAPRLCDEVWKLAKDLDCNVFVRELGSRVSDDHVSLLKYGIPAIDIIDFEYPHWHRLSDTPENCAPEGMEQVAKVLSVWMQRQK